MYSVKSIYNKIIQFIRTDKYNNLNKETDISSDKNLNEEKKNDEISSDKNLNEEKKNDEISNNVNLQNKSIKKIINILFVFLSLFLGFLYYKHNFNYTLINKLNLINIINNYNILKIIIDNYESVSIHCEKNNILNIFYLEISKYESFEKYLNHEFKDKITSVPIIYHHSKPIPWFQYIFTVGIIYTLWNILKLKITNKNIFNNDLMEPSKINVKLEDIAGMDQKKAEVLDIVDIIMKPHKYLDIGAKIPSGILLEGPPGTGKTMIAKAISEHYKCPFYNISGSDFIQVFVGLGSQKVKDLFKNARNNVPCIIFIDEIDAIGKKRNGSSISSNEERENILNALLVEMDGFEPNNKILIIGATNRVDVLDNALLRPGRFDRIITFELPNLKSRKDILLSYINKLKIKNDDKLNISENIAGLTTGFNNSQLANICNEAAIDAVKNGKDLIDIDNFEFAIDYVLLGPIKEKTNTEKIKIIAYHEIGHALVAYKLDKMNPPRKISIIPRGKGILGFSQHSAKDEDEIIYQIDELENQLMVLMGGRIAEKIKFNKFSTGAFDDLQKINKLIRDMICRYGMNNIIGGMQINSNSKEDFFSNNSEQYKFQVDSEINKLIKHLEMKTEKIILDNEIYFEKLAQKLLSCETLFLEDIENIYKDNFINEL